MSHVGYSSGPDNGILYKRMLHTLIEKPYNTKGLLTRSIGIIQCEFHK